ncbi:hypothetical protein UCDDA912_g05703 [Diaporthe ampelina]|uniref:Uncharacterized protein n=1 Tax=Diaporthe ampelina TaxID=1214573 RepID=A0A0G2HGT2_9PEZI|nr:hypothetical protein UCDDA912_g05703 [Diaporthe ampelina]
MLASRFRVGNQLRRPVVTRSITTLSNNPDIKVFPNPVSPSASYLLTYLSAEPPNPGLAIGTTTELPPTPRSFSENGRFLGILNEVLAAHAHLDADLRAAAQAFASPGGFNLGGGMMRGKGKRKGGSDGAGGASDQGGAGGGGAGGWVHLSDRRNPPDFGRIAWPEDIFGSVQVDSKGNIEGNFQTSGTYRIVTNEGIHD